MLKKITVVLLLGSLGLISGVAFGVLFPRYYVSDALLLPRHSPRSASELVTMTRGDHPGVDVVAHGHSISFSATGSLADSDRAVTLATRKVIAANDGQVKSTFLSNPGRAPVDTDALIGLMIGLLAGLGTFGLLLLPPRWRTTFAGRARALGTKLSPWTLTYGSSKPTPLRKPM